jgi:glycosyltransferase involved in cell wall biosynthesis
MQQLKEFTTLNGEVLLYAGNPVFSKLDELANGPGDVWHSSLDQGFTNAFEDIIYQTAIYWWYLNDFENLDTSISWRINENSFVVRKSVWDLMGGFDSQFTSPYMKGIEFGYHLLRSKAGITLHIKGLFEPSNTSVKISKNDRYLFYRKHFKIHHSYYMMYRKGLLNLFSEFKAFQFAKKQYRFKESKRVPIKELKKIQGKPTVSLVIPTMKRQAYTQLLLEDHKNQHYLIKEAVIVDATPMEERNDKYYRQEDFPFEVKVHWQTTKGSCIARNEAINLCTGDYIIFADDDIRILPDFVENHIRFLQTYQVPACNGLDIMAENIHQNLDDLKERLAKIENTRWKAGVTAMFSNANSVVERKWMQTIIGNDINFDGGYGEDADVGLSIVKKGGIVLFNPFSANLHLKPPTGGYRWWGTQSKLVGKKRKKQPWELDNPVKFIRPVPSPTVTYGILKHFKKHQISEWRSKHFFIYLFKGTKKGFLVRLLKLPYKQMQFSKSLWYAKQLIKLGPRFK